MKFRKDKDILKRLGFSLGAILVGIFVLLFIKPITTIGLFLISSGVMGLIISLRLASKPKDYFLQDERSVRIKEKAGYYAYEIMLSLAAIIYGSSYSEAVPLINSFQRFFGWSSLGYRTVLFLDT